MRNRIGSILLGLIFVLVGIGFLGNIFAWWSFDLFFDGWWTLFIIIPCLAALISQGPNFGNLFGLIVGCLLLLSRQGLFDMHFVSRLIVPALFILIGCAILFRGRRNAAAQSAAAQLRAEHSGRLPEYCAVFSGQTIRPVGERFDGCEGTAVFGGLDLHLENAIIDHDIAMNLTAVFGGIDIFLPASVKVVYSSVPIFGGVSNRRPPAVDEGAPTVYINAVAVFGGVDIK